MCVGSLSARAVRGAGLWECGVSGKLMVMSELGPPWRRGGVWEDIRWMSLVSPSASYLPQGEPFCPVPGFLPSLMFCRTPEQLHGMDFKLVSQKALSASLLCSNIFHSSRKELAHLHSSCLQKHPDRHTERHYFLICYVFLNLVKLTGENSHHKCSEYFSLMKLKFI